MNKAGTPEEVESAYKTFQSKKSKIMTKSQEKSLARTKKKYINLIRKYKAPKKAAKRVASYKSSAIKKINKATSASSVKNSYSKFKTSAASAVRDANAAGHNYIFTADGKRIYEGRTYNTSYWGDKDSNRTIKVTYVHPITKIQGGDWFMGIDVKNGGVYDCSVCTSTNALHRSYEHGFVCNNITYDAYGRIIQSGKNKGQLFPTTKDAGGTVKWLGNGWHAKQITILKSNVTVVETIDGTEPTLDHYYSKWTKASTNGDSFSTYKWGMGTAEDGTIWSRATRWVRVYEGNKLILDNRVYFYSWNE